jgi:hypothetical protein
MGLDEDVIRHRVVLSHTPKRGWSEEKKSGTVLITGSHPDVARRIAKEYVLDSIAKLSPPSGPGTKRGTATVSSGW